MGTESAGMCGHAKWLAAVLLLAGAAPSIGSADAVTAVSGSTNHKDDFGPLTLDFLVGHTACACYDGGRFG